MATLNVGDKVKLKEIIPANISGFQYRNFEFLMESYGRFGYHIKVVDRCDSTYYIVPSKCEKGYGRWVSFNSVELDSVDEVNSKTIMSIVMNKLGLEVFSLKETKFTFEGEIYPYDQREKIFQILTDRVPDVTPSNIGQVIKQLQEIEQVWSQM